MIDNKKAIIEHICQEIRKFTDVAVVGMSGGADSTLVATLCKLALGEDNVYGVHMPYGELDHEIFNARSVAVGYRLGVHKIIAPINQVVDPLVNTISNLVLDEVGEVNAGNARSRVRMMFLYGIGHHLSDVLNCRVRVIGTGNLSEDYIGYDTKGGDALADIFPIGDLFKSEIYQLLDHMRDEGHIDEEHIDRVPSAGLWDGQTDEKELGYTYDEMEPIIRSQLAGDVMPLGPDKLKEPYGFVCRRHAANKHKHEAPPVIKLRRIIDG